MDFIDTSIPEKKRMWWPEWTKDLPRKVIKAVATKKYTTKKEIKQDIQLINDKLNLWLGRKQEARDQEQEIYMGFCED